MKKLNLPHLEPVKFAKKILSKKDDTYSVEITFDAIPSLAMLVEASAQSSAAFGEGDEVKAGFLVTLKNIELLEELQSLSYKVEVTSHQQIGALTYFSFKVFKEVLLVSTGTFIIAVQ